MKNRVKLGNQHVSDVKRFFEILSNPTFKYYLIKPKSLKAEVDFLKQNTKKRWRSFEHNYSILYNGNVIGTTGLRKSTKNVDTLLRKSGNA